MSSSDDERQSSNQGDSTGDSAPKRTLMGMGLGQPAVKSSDEFAAEATQIADDLADAMMEDIDSMFDEPAPEKAEELDDFEGEKTEVGQGLRVQDDDRPKLPPIPRPRPKASVPASNSKPGPPPTPKSRAEASVNAPRRTLGGLPVGLDEDSLPEPIRDEDEPRQRIPTKDGELPAINRHTGEQQPVGAGLSSQGREPSSGDGELPAPIRNENPWSAENRQEGITVLEDGEFHDEKTEMVDTPFESDPIVAKLVTLGGPENGTEYFASGLQNTVGRGINNTVVVPDLAMSRQHFEIIRNPDDSYTIRDLQSVNGTTLNGAKIREADLFHGDRIEAGKSLFQFVITGPAQPMQRQRRMVPAATATVDPENPPTVAPPPARPADTSSLQRLIIMVSLGAVLFSLTLIAVIALLRLQQGEEKPEAAVATQQESASSVYLSGVEAVRARDWDGAEAQFNKAKELDPSLDGIDEQLRRIGVEREAMAALSSAREHLDGNELDEARELLTGIPRDSVYYAESRGLLRDTRKSEVEALYAEAQQALTDEDLQLSQEKIAKILSLVPTHQGATRLRDRIEAIESGEVDVDDVVEEEAQAVAANNPRAKRRQKSENEDDWGIELVDLSDEPKRKRRKRRTSSKSEGSRVPNFTRGFLLYRTRKFDQAQSFFEDAASTGGPASSRAERTAKAIGDFETAYKAGNAAFKSGDWSTAEKKLIAAKRADSSVGGDYFDGELSTKLATAKAKLGLAELERGNATEARSLYLQGRNFNSGDSTVKELGKQLEKEARSLYIKAVNKRKTDPAQAAKLCRNIMRIVPKSNETYGQASQLLKSL